MLFGTSSTTNADVGVGDSRAMEVKAREETDIKAVTRESSKNATAGSAGENS